MSGFLSEPSFMPCSECGASLERSERDGHVCDPERQVEYELVQLRPEIQSFHDRLAGWLDSPAGRFAVWDAEQRR